MPANRYPRYYKSFADSGAVGNANGDPASAVTGFTDDTVAAQAFIDAQPSTGCDLMLDRWYYVPNGLTRWKSNMGIVGSNSGCFRGNPAYLTSGGLPIPTTQILVQGTLIGTPLAYTSTFASGTKDFVAANSFAVNDVLLLSNFPTDPGGTDAYTQPGGTSAPRLYNYVGTGALGTAGQGMIIHANNQRQYRRRELVVLSDVQQAGAGAGFSIYSPCAYAYNINASQALTGLQFQKVNAIQNAIFENVNLLDCSIVNDLTYAPKVVGGHQYRSTVSLNRTLYGQILEFNLDAEKTDTAMIIGASSGICDLIGNARGGRINSDNGLIRVDQAHNYRIKANITGYSGNMAGCLIDTNYFQAPDGYTDVPTNVGNVDLLIAGGYFGLFATCDPFSANIDTLMLNIIGGNTPLPDAVYLKGCVNVMGRLLIPYGYLRCDGTQADIDFKHAGFYAPGPSAGGPSGNGVMSDPRVVKADIVNTIRRSTYVTY